MIRRGVALGAAVLGGALTGCNSGAISEATLSGKIGGEPWTFVEGYAEAAPPEATELHVALYGAAIDDGCAPALAPGNKILFRMPRETGSYALSLLQNVTLVLEYEGGVDNFVATTGTMDIRSISDVAIDAGLVASFERDPDLSVNGTFAVEICPYLE